MEKDPQRPIDEQELDEQQTEEVAGGRDLPDADLKRLAAAGADKLAEVSRADLDNIAAGRLDPSARNKEID